MEEAGATVGDYTTDSNITSSTVSDDGTITNTYEDTTTAGTPTVEDVIEQVATEAHDGYVDDSTWDSLNNIFSQEYSEGGMTR